MAWQWRYESATGDVVDPGAAGVGEAFPSQADAETWLGDNWRDLLAAGVQQVTLLEGDRQVYGPMGLEPA